MKDFTYQEKCQYEKILKTLGPIVLDPVTLNAIIRY